MIVPCSSINRLCECFNVSGVSGGVPSPLNPAPPSCTSHHSTPQATQKMSVSLDPSSQLSFRKPFTSLVKQNLKVYNYNSQPVAFKVKTTAPKLYCVRPNAGRIEPGESIDVSGC
ncbi:PapD-like protein [Serendipita vermifera]|nr:PapD-like protein [Serendipita vermifera]